MCAECLGDLDEEIVRQVLELSGSGRLGGLPACRKKMSWLSFLCETNRAYIALKGVKTSLGRTVPELRLAPMTGAADQEHPTAACRQQNPRQCRSRNHSQVSPRNPQFEYRFMPFMRQLFV